MTARASHAQQRREKHLAVSAGRPARLARVASVHGRRPPARRFAVSVENGAELLVIDTGRARVERARRRVSVWAASVPEQVERGRGAAQRIETPRLVMVTLTYRDAAGWRPGDIRAYMLALRAQLGRGLLAYAWVLEMQSRGAPHYHVMLYVRRGVRVPTPDASGMWRAGMSNIQTVSNPRYIVKYAGKEHQKEMLPAGARMFAVWVRADVLPQEAALLYRSSPLPSWMRAIVADHYSAAPYGGGPVARRAPGGGWVLVATGECHASPWRVVGIEEISGRVLWSFVPQ